MFPRLRSFLTTLSQPRRFAAALDEEVRFHLEAEADYLIQCGLAPWEAMHHAKLRFGSITAMKDQCRQARGLAAADGLRQRFSDIARVVRRTRFHSHRPAGWIRLQT